MRLHRGTDRIPATDMPPFGERCRRVFLVEVEERVEIAVVERCGDQCVDFLGLCPGMRRVLRRVGGAVSAHFARAVATRQSQDPGCSAPGCDNRRMAMGSSPERLRGDLIRLLHRETGVRDFSLAAARIVGRAVPFDGVCVLTRWTLRPGCRRARSSRTGSRRRRRAASDRDRAARRGRQHLRRTRRRGDAQRGDERGPRPQPAPSRAQAAQRLRRRAARRAGQRRRGVGRPHAAAHRRPAPLHAR